MAQAGEVIAQKIKQVITNQPTITTAIDALKHDIPFLHDEACYHLIMDILKQNTHLQLINDYNTKRVPESDTDIDRETDDMLATFDERELKEYTQTLQSNDNICVMDWNKVIECVNHEMWPKLGSIIKGILRKKGEEMMDCEVKEEDITTVMETLKNKGIAAESINYLQELIERAMHWNRNPKQYDDERGNENDFDALLSDIWSVYKWFHFAHFNLTEYSFHQFQKDIRESAHRFKPFLGNKSITNIRIAHDECNLYPQYLINDDIFDIF
eukprot:1015905_1